jgi:hypothetical protein
MSAAPGVEFGGSHILDPRKSGTMYIGLGTLVFVLVVVGIVYFVRRA